MSHDNVERLIGRLVTDEGFRRLFAADPTTALESVARGGHALTDSERRALVSLDARRVARLAAEIDPRLQKIDFEGERS